MIHLTCVLSFQQGLNKLKPSRLRCASCRRPARPHSGPYLLRYITTNSIQDVEVRNPHIPRRDVEARSADENVGRNNSPVVSKRRSPK